jgi:hypothetical protein
MPQHGSRVVPLVLAGLLALAPALAASLVLTPVALAAAPAPTETYAKLLAQIDAKPPDPQRVTHATLDKTDHHVRVTLADGSRPLVSYPPAQDKFLVDTLIRHGVKPVYSKRPAVHHTLRYIAAGVVAVLLLIGGGVWFYTRGREPDLGTEDEQPTAA